jgi:pimeloyl-ACP methyl ester carboxylesterase
MTASGTRFFAHDGQRLAYEEVGTGSRPVVLLPGLLLPRRMHHPLARRLARRGHRVLLLDPLSHGDSDRVEGVGRYSMTAFAEQTVALLAHLGLDEAVVGGTSLGANVALEMGLLAPERMRGMVLEMPVLEGGMVVGALVFPPAVLAIRAGARLLEPLAALARRVPRGSTALGDSLLSWVSQDPRASADVIHGLLYGRTAPSRTERRAIDVPALVIAHRLDPLHPLDDCEAAVRDLPDARMVRARTMLEMRFAPDRLAGEIADFLDEVWARDAGAPRLAPARDAGARPASASL